MGQKIKINKINTEVERVAAGHYIFNHQMARITKIKYNPEDESWEIFTPGKRTLSNLNHQKMVEILMGHCGFEVDTSRVIAEALSLELKDLP